jgi:hypothetical protein
MISFGLKLAATGSFQAQVVIHDPLKGTLVPGLLQVYRVHPSDKPGATHSDVEQPVQAMDPMPRDGVVTPDEPSGEVGNNPVLIVETDLEMEMEHG